MEGETTNGGATIATEGETRETTKRSHDQPLSLYPLTEDEVLQQLLDAGPLPGKQQMKKKTRHYGGATSTPKPKPQKGK